MKRWILLGLISVLSANMMLDDLGWVGEPGTRCLGHFSVDSELSLKGDRIHFNSEESSLWDGEAWVFDRPLAISHKNTKFDLQSGRWYLKDKRWIFDKTSRLIHPPMRLVAEEGQYYPQDQSAFLSNVQFRVGPTRDHHLAIWGEAEEASWKDKNTLLRDVQMSICSPKRPIWSLGAREAVFKHNDRVMYLKHVVAKLFGMPVFYLPWLDLNLKRERDSGLLSPQVYFNRGTLFLAMPVYWNMATYADMTFAPLLSIQNQLGGLIQGRYLSPWGPSEMNGFYVRDGSVNRYRLSSDIHWKSQFWDADMKGYQVSDSTFVEDYPRFAQNISWLIPWSARGRVHNDHIMFEGGIDSYQDFSPQNASTVFAYYDRLPWMKLSAWGHWRNWMFKSDSKYGRYIPTASYSNLLESADFFSHTAGTGTQIMSPLGTWSLWGDHVVTGVSGGQSMAHNTRGVMSWMGLSHLGDWRVKSRVGLLLGSVSSNQTMPLLEGRPKVFNYDQLFQLDRFTLETRVGDYRDIDWNVEGQSGSLVLGMGSRYALRLHRVSAQEGIDVYDPLLTKHMSPLVTMASWQEGPWQLIGRMNVGRGENFQYSQQVNYQDDRLKLGLYAFKMPIDYPSYLTPDEVNNITAVGALWHLKITEQWRFNWEWFTQMDQSQSGYLMALRYQDCCLQFGVGVKRSLLPIESESSPRTQWFAEVDFDTGSSITDTV